MTSSHNGSGTSASPRLSRRREVSHASARSMLMTVLGEFVLPRGRPVWTSTLVDVLAMFDVEEKSARQALSRTANEGWLESERVGRRVRWSLSERGRKLLREGARRIYEFGHEETTWDGRWLVLLASVPESKRDLRHRLRTRLTWIGFGSPSAGLWISPHAAQEAEAKRILTDLGLDDEAMSFVSSYGEIGAEQTLVSRAWELGELEERYASFIAEFGELEPDSPAATLQAQTKLVHEWRRFPFLDPQLPLNLLPENWTGAVAASVFHGKHAEWRVEAQRFWDATFERVTAA